MEIAALFRYGFFPWILAGNVIPRLEAGVGKVGYGIALGEISGPKKQKGQPNVGAAQSQMFPIGKRMTPAERNTTMQRCPRRPSSGMAVCLDYNAHSGCTRGVQCKFAHDFIGGENLHWGVEAELIRRGGFRKRNAMTKDPLGANASIDELRGKNQMAQGEQKMDMSKSVGKSELSDNAPVVDINQACAIHELDCLPGLPSIDNREKVPSASLEQEVSTTETCTRMDWEIDRQTVSEMKLRANPPFTAVTEDFFHLDITESEHDGQAILCAADARVRPSIVHGCRPVPMSGLTPRQRAIAVWREVNAVGDLRIAPFISNRLGRRAVSGD